MGVEVPFHVRIKIQTHSTHTLVQPCAHCQTITCVCVCVCVCVRVCVCVFKYNLANTNSVSTDYHMRSFLIIHIHTCWWGTDSKASCVYVLIALLKHHKALNMDTFWIAGDRDGSQVGFCLSPVTSSQWLFWLSCWLLLHHCHLDLWPHLARGNKNVFCIQIVHRYDFNMKTFTPGINICLEWDAIGIWWLCPANITSSSSRSLRSTKTTKNKRKMIKQMVAKWEVVSRGLLASDWSIWFALCAGWLMAACSPAPATLLV